MVYGTKLIWKYADEIPVVKNGEYVVDDSGDIVVEKVEKKLDLTFNAMTLLLYKNYFDREFMQDFTLSGAQVEKQYKDNKELIDKARNSFADLSENEIEQLGKLSFDNSIEFILRAIVAMIATTEYPTKREVGEIINEIPLSILNNDKFTDELTQLIGFGVKKNYNL